MLKQKLPRLIGITIKELQSRSPSLRRKVRRAFVHNAGILFGLKGQERVKDHLDQGRAKADALRCNADKSRSSI